MANDVFGRINKNHFKAHFSCFPNCPTNSCQSYDVNIFQISSIVVQPIPALSYIIRNNTSVEATRNNTPNHPSNLAAAKKEDDQSIQAGYRNNRTSLQSTPSLPYCF
jgi:hypothetical protein